MYKYAATDSIFDGVSNIYLISIATAFLAVIVALYFSNFLKDESEKQLNEVLNDVGDGYEDEMSERDEDYLNDTTELEDHYQIQQGIKERLKDDELENISDYEYSDSYKNIYAKDNYSTNNNNTGDECDSDEIVQADGLVSKMKSKRVKELEAQLTRDQMEEEKRIEREQLAAIFELLKKQEAELNMKEIDESELTAQLALYR